MRFAPLTLAVVLSVCVSALLFSNPAATAQEGAAGLDGVTEGTLVLANGAREAGKLRLVTMGGETFVHVDKEPSARYVNLRSVTYVMAKASK
jgi:hypothetical protein